MSEPHPEVDAFVEAAESWQAVTRGLRSVLLDCGLEEGLKWRKPCYMWQGRNVAIIQHFKEHCALMFFQGALLEDSHGLLREQGKNTRSALRLEFRREAELREGVLKGYVEQAIAIAQSGREVDLAARDRLELPDELRAFLRKDAALRRAFEALTPGRQRGYVLHFGEAKQAKTRVARIEKAIPRILAGKGRNDR